MVAQLPEVKAVDEDFLHRFEEAEEIISQVRNLRSSKNLSPREALVLEVSEKYPTDLDAVLIKLANLSAVERKAVKSEGAVSFVIGTEEFAVPMAAYINVEEEIAKLEADLAYQQKFLASVMKKLSNESFVAKAPEKVIAIERKKQADAESRIATIEQSLSQLRN